MSRTLMVFVLAAVSAAACSRDPVTASRSYLESGDRYAQSGQYRDAAIQYRNAERLTPQSPEVHEKLAEALMQERHRGAAAAEYLHVAELDPGSATAQVRAASLYLLAGRFPDARDRAEAALAASPRDVGALVALGEALTALHDAARGEASLREAVRVDPRSPDARVALGSAYWSAGRRADAEAELTRAVALAPAHAGAVRALALFYTIASRHREAEARWTALARLPDGDPFALADYYGATGRLADGERELTRLAGAEATRTAASLRLATIQVARGERADARATLAAVVAGDPHNVAALLARARLLAGDGRFDEALAAAGAAADSDAGAATTIGVILEATGRREAARRHYEETLARFPHAPVAANNLACIYADEGRLDEALAQALAAYDEMPQSPEVNDTLGWVHLRRHEPLDALAPLRAAVAARPDNATYRSHLDLANAQAARRHE
jgi:tetratricopeptide (TPR) repeat protein